MKRELRDRWVAALRSGEYEQGRGELRGEFTGVRFCCLGVLADLEGVDWTTGHGVSGISVLPKGPPALASLPEAARRDLVNLNDTYRQPFPVIADWIERNVKVED